MPRKIGKIGAKRRARLSKEIAPLICRGLTNTEIAESLGISLSTVSHDVAVVKRMWADSLSDEINELRGKAVAQYDFLAREALDSYFEGKEKGYPGDKFLGLAGTFFEKRNKLIGIGADINFNQTNIVAGEATIHEVSEVFAPMNASDYSAFIAEKGALTALPPIPQKDAPEAIHDPGTTIHADPADNSWGAAPH